MLLALVFYSGELQTMAPKARTCAGGLLLSIYHSGNFSMELLICIGPWLLLATTEGIPEQQSTANLLRSGCACTTEAWDCTKKEGMPTSLFVHCTCCETQQRSCTRLNKNTQHKRGESSAADRAQHGKRATGKLLLNAGIWPCILIPPFLVDSASQYLCK